MTLTGSTQNYSIPFGFELGVLDTQMYFIALEAVNGSVPSSPVTARCGGIPNNAAPMNMLSFIYGLNISSNDQVAFYPNAGYNTTTPLCVYVGSFSPTNDAATLRAAESSLTAAGYGFLFNVVR